MTMLNARAVANTLTRMASMQPLKLQDARSPHIINTKRRFDGEGFDKLASKYFVTGLVTNLYCAVNALMS
jgi:hypothetical protein